MSISQLKCEADGEAWKLTLGWRDLTTLGVFNWRLLNVVCGKTFVVHFSQRRSMKNYWYVMRWQAHTHKSASESL